jgi:anti-sigma factor RsiW
VSHLGREQIAAYSAGRLAEEELFGLDRHLASCPDCARRVRAFRFVTEHADVLLDAWSAQTASLAALQTRVAVAASESTLPDSVVERIRLWVKGLSTGTRAVLTIAMEGAKRSAEIVDEGLGWLGRPAPGFQPIPVAVRVLGDGGEGAASVESRTHPWARVTADPSTGVVAVQLARVAEPWPIAVLLPRQSEAAMIAEFRPVEGEDYLLATFEDVADGGYTLLLEDTRSDSNSHSPLVGGGE